MSTTNLFVELIVVGTGAALTVVVLFYTLFGDYSGFSQKLFTLLQDNFASIIPVLSFIYVLGIVVDKISYSIFKPIEDGLREKPFGKDGYDEARHCLYTMGNAQKAAEAFEFGRSKIRICRGWTVNCVLLALMLIGFMVLRQRFDYVVLFAVVALGLLAWGTVWSWRTATIVEHRLLKRFYKQSGYPTTTSEAAELA